MRSRILACALLFAAPLAPSAASAAAAPSRDGWPATRAGEIGRGYLVAFAGGDAAMTAFYQKEMSAEALAKKPAAERLVNYRKTREKFGTLTLGKVIKSTPGELTVTLLDGDGTPHEYIFTLAPAAAGAAPSRLETISMRERRAGGHGGLAEFFHGKH